MLKADVRKGEGGVLVKCGHLWTGGMGRKTGHFLQTSFVDVLTVQYGCNMQILGVFVMALAQ